MNRTLFLQLLDEIASPIPGLSEILAPFGFEVAGDARARDIAPRRIYFYAQATEMAEKDEIADVFGESLKRHATDLFNTVGARAEFLTIGGRARTITLSTDVGFAAHLYWVCGTSATLLDDYARYVALLPAAILDGALNEIKHFDSRPSCRRFVFQSARMFPNIHDDILSDDDLEALRDRARLNGSGLHDHVERKFVQASSTDLTVLNTVVLPACARIVESLHRGGTDQSTWIDFHNNEFHTYNVNSRLLQRRTERVKGAYLNRPLQLSYDG